MPADIDVIVFNVVHLANEPWVLSKIRNLLDESLSRFILRMGFTGEEELHRTLRIVSDRSEAIKISKQKIGSLVSGKPSAEPNRQNRWIAVAKRRFEILSLFAPLLILLVYSTTNKRE